MSVDLSHIVATMRQTRVIGSRIGRCGRHRVHSEADRIMWWKLYVHGESIAGIARKYGCWPSTVRKELKPCPYKEILPVWRGQ